MTSGRRAAIVAALAVAALTIAVACSGQEAEQGSGTPPTPLPPVAPTSPATTAPGASAPGTAGSATTAGSVTSAPPTPGDVAIKLTEVASLDQPIALAWRAGDPALYVAERGGVIRAVRNGTTDPEPVADLSALTAAGGERGLLGLALSPDGRYLYVNYTDRNGDTNVDELVLDADGRADPASRRRVLFQDQPYPNHNGGDLRFGPDGYLYVGLGDGGAAGDPERRAMRLDTWLGKILRIDPRPGGGQPYQVPVGNPFVDQTGALPEIWSYGLRNPWRFSFDAATGDLWIGDVGQNALEEVDEAPATAGRDAGKGLNFGWSAFEGTKRYNDDQPADGTVGPVYEYRHGDALGGCAITGGYVYRGRAIPALTGTYLFADYCAGGVRAIPTGVTNPAAALLSADPGSVASFGQGPDGELYVLSLGGPVYRIDPA